MIQYLSLFFHAIIVTIIFTVTTFSTNIYILLFLFIGVCLAFLQAKYFDGCVVSKFDSEVPFFQMKPNGILLSLFGLDEDYIRLEDLERILIGFTALYVLLKLYVLLILQYVFEFPSYTKFLISIHSSKVSGFQGFLKYITS